jgi:hypothetical protein
MDRSVGSRRGQGKGRVAHFQRRHVVAFAKVWPGSYRGECRRGRCTLGNDANRATIKARLACHDASQFCRVLTQCR